MKVVEHKRPPQTPVGPNGEKHELGLLREQHRLMSVELSDLILKRVTLNVAIRSSMSRLDRLDLLIERWTIDDAIETLEERRVELERDYEDLTRAFSQAANLRRDLAPEGRYDEAFREAEDRLIDVQRRMDEAQFRLRN